MKNHDTARITKNFLRAVWESVLDLLYPPKPKR